MIVQKAITVVWYDQREDFFKRFLSLFVVFAFLIHFYLLSDILNLLRIINLTLLEVACDLQFYVMRDL